MIMKARRNAVPNATVLFFVRGWGHPASIEAIATELGTTSVEIERADLVRMIELMRLAQRKRAVEHSATMGEIIRRHADVEGEHELGVFLAHRLVLA